MARVCALQRQYGKTQAELEVLVDGFSWALAEFSIEEVAEAISKYIKSKPDIPTPSDIRALICPEKEDWRPDWELYKNYKKLLEDRGPYALSDDEAAYVRACEDYSINRFNAVRHS